MPTLNEITTYLYKVLIYAGNHLPCPQMDPIICVIISVIVVLSVGALLALLANLRNFWRERHQLGILEWLLDDREGGLINDTNTFYKMVLLNLHRDTLVYERVAVVSNLMGNQKMAINLSELSDLTVAKNEAQFKNQLVNFAIAVLLIIGLAGTFWAFRDILTNSGISQAISNNSLDVNLYKEAINKIYGGFQHAFLASLAGIVGTVLLLFIKYLWVNPLRENFFYQLDWVTQTRLMPLFAGPNLTDQVTERLLVTATKFETAVSHIQSLSQEMKDNVVSAKGLALELHQLSEKVRDIAELFKYTTGEESPFYKAASRLYDAVNQSQQHYEELGEGVGDLINQNQEWMDQQRSQNEQLKQVQMDFVKIHQQVNQHLEQINRNFNTLTQQSLAQTGMVAKELQGLIAGLKHQQSDYTTEFEQLVRKIQDSALVAAEATQQLNVFLEKVNEQAKETIPQLSQIGFSGFMGKVEEHGKKLTGLLEEQTRDILVELNQMDSLQRIEQTVAGLPKSDYSTDMQELLRVLKEIQESLRKRRWLEWLGRK